MKPKIFKGANITYGTMQPEYQPLPAHKDNTNGQGVVTCCWQLNWRERIKVLFTGLVWSKVMTFPQPIQPQLLSIDKPDELGGE